MRLLVTALAIVLSTVATATALAQQQTAKPEAPKPAGELSGDTNIDPTADTDNPTLLKAQIMILQNAREAKRAVLAPLSDFQDFVRFDVLASQKQQKLNAIVQARTQQATRGAQTTESQKADFDAEVKALAKANKEKTAAAEKNAKPK